MIVLPVNILLRDEYRAYTRDPEPLVWEIIFFFSLNDTFVCLFIMCMYVCEYEGFYVFHTQSWAGGCQKSIGFHKTRVTGSSKPPRKRGTLNLGPQQEWVFLMAEPFLQTQRN